MADILSQEEIDKLLEITDEEDREIQRNNRNKSKNYTKTELYDFKRPIRFSKQHMRSFRGLHDSFAENLTKYLSGKYKQTEVILHSIDQLSYGEYIMMLPSSTSLSVLDMNGLPGNAVMEINPDISFGYIDLFLGGTGDSYDTSRKFNELELKILEDVFKDYSTELEKAWKPIKDFDINISDLASSPNIKSVASQDEIVLMVVLEVRMGYNSGMMNICYPYKMLENILPKIEKYNNPSYSTPMKSFNYKEILDVPLEVTVLVNEKEITIEDLKHLYNGEFLSLDKDDNEPLGILAGGELIGYGEVLNIDGRFSMRVTEIV